MQLLHPGVAAAYMRHATFQADRGAREARVWSFYRMGMDGKGGSNGLKAGDRVAEVRGRVERSSVHRARFLDGMVELVPDGCVTFGKRVVDVRDLGCGNGEGKLEVEFADGTKVAVDAVVGCDGVKSRVRQIVLDGEEQPEPVFTGKYAYRGLVPMNEAVEALGELTAQNAHFHWGYDGHVLTFPIEHGETMNVVAFRTKMDGRWEHGSKWVLPGDRERMFKDFEGWGKDVQSILRMMRNSDIWALFDHPSASTYYKDGICLLGDAAHASTPHQGAGAGMAIEDAFILSRLIANMTHRDQLHAAFQAYDSVRRPRTQRLVTTSRDAACLYEFQKLGIGDDPEKLRADLEGRMKWVWDVDLNQHLAEAMEIFNNEVSKS
ncbi:MAG: hypothetical protein M1820_001310 [Bogoriella megaspora]|nr:MAG: hypothetical protein M1820_001310 [Bogoriella megaspora]